MSEMRPTYHTAMIIFAYIEAKIEMGGGGGYNIKL